MVDERTTRIHIISGDITKISCVLIKWGGILLVAKYASDAIIALSGKTTLANINLNAQADSCSGCGPIYWTALFLAIILAIAGYGYGKVQMRLKRRFTKMYYPYYQMHEERLDPKRSSSKLLPTGDTRPEDK